MKASIAHAVRPTVLMGANPRKPWNETDTLWAVSYQRYLNELCPQCGYPKYVCHNSDNEIQFKGIEDECTVMAQIERKQADLAEAKTKQYGIRLGAEPYLMKTSLDAGLELSDFRRPYFRERAKAAGLLPDDAD